MAVSEDGVTYTEDSPATYSMTDNTVTSGYLPSNPLGISAQAQAANDRRFAMLATLDGIIAAQLAKMAEAAHPGDKATLLDQLVTVRGNLETAW